MVDSAQRRVQINFSPDRHVFFLLDIWIQADFPKKKDDKLHLNFSLFMFCITFTMIAIFLFCSKILFLTSVVSTLSVRRDEIY